MRNVHNAGSESELQTLVCDYLRLRFPSVIFHSDLASGMKLTVGQAVRAKRLNSSRAYPDLFIAEQRYVKQDKEMYGGLFLELKRPGTKLYKKGGSLVSDVHIREQAAMLARLRERGYRAEFAVGFDQARLIIDEYLEDATASLPFLEHPF